MKQVDPKTVENQPVGESVTENAIAITNYDLVSATSQSITLVRNSSENVIVFYYRVALTDYTVKYLEAGTNKKLANSKTVTGQAVGSDVWEDAINIDGYSLIGDNRNGICLVADASRNVINFYYEKETKETISYTVKYVDINTYNPVADDKVVTDVPVGQHVTETPVYVRGYICISGNLEWTAENDGEVKLFIYYYTGEGI